MSLTADIITDAMRETNLIGANEYPNQRQQAEAMRLLNRLVSAVYGYDVGEALEDWMVGTAGIDELSNRGWTELNWRNPIQNSRILLNNTSPQTLLWPVAPDNGARMQIIDISGTLATYPVTIDGNGRLIEGDRVQLLVTNGLNTTWMFDAANANWVQVANELTVTGKMPFPMKFDDYFVIKLAARLNPRYGRSLSEESLARLAEQRDQLEAEYRQTRPMPAPLAVRRLSSPLTRYFGASGRGGKWGWQ